MSTPASNASDSDGSSTIRKSAFSVQMNEEIEPYVRRRRVSSERNRKRLEKLSEEEQNLLRTSINSRERRRMHDLNDALDELRSVLPYSNGATARRLSKINTIILASNCIRNLNKRFTDMAAEIEQLRAMIPEDKLSTIKLPAVQLADTIVTDLPTTLMPPAKKQRLSSSPVGRTIDLPATLNETKKINKATPSPQQRSAPPTKLEPVLPMALLAAAAFNLHGQHRSIPAQTPVHQFPPFGPPPPQFCMKRFNPASFCTCVSCFVQNANFNAALINRTTVKPNSDR